MKLFKILTISFTIFAILFLTIFYFYNKEIKKQSLGSYQMIVSINQNSFFADVANNEYLRAKGLSGRDSIGENEAMLFVFDTLGNYGFWMKDMNFPIDIVWIGEDKKVNHIEKSVSPSSYPQMFNSEEHSLYVLEFKSGITDKFGIEIGDTVVFKRK